MPRKSDNNIKNLHDQSKSNIYPIYSEFAKIDPIKINILIFDWDNLFNFMFNFKK